MRESIGTAWLMIIVMTFITLFSGYLAFSINYSKSFRVKDGIIERIHKYNGFVNESGKNTLVDIDDFLHQIGYNARGNCYDLCKEEVGDSDQKFAGIKGTEYAIGEATQGNTYNYCIIRVRSNKKGWAQDSTSYYKVIVFFSLQIGQISLFSKFHTTGETQALTFSRDFIFND